MSRIRRVTAALLVGTLPLNVSAAPQESYETWLRVALDDATAEVPVRRAVPAITEVTDLDLLPPADLAAVHRDRRLTGGRTQPTPERQAASRR